ncbi:hypothetical protein LIER_22964 [Lithospermum erythrorhizon]|uniref:ZCF37 n=1 Tax=Lithospermum erythrorhizon TaxID=34254 RepID=A0AAV3QVY8_LITER
MFCGSFHSQEDDDIMESMSPCSSPKRSKRNSSSYKSKNRYADRGLDKFNALLSVVDKKKQKIYTQKGAEDISLVRFVISDDNQIKPLVVKVKEKRQSTDSNNNNIIKDQTTEMKKNQSFKNEKELEVEQKQIKKQSCSCNCPNSIDLEKLKHPWVYLPVIVILILMFLVFYGRSFAIICTSIGWYLMPTIMGQSTLNTSGNSTSRNPKKKKEYTKRLSEKTFVSKNGNNVNGGGSSSPTSVIGGPTDLLSTPKHGHQKSW